MSEEDVDGAFVEGMMRDVMSGAVKPMPDALEQCIEKFWADNSDLKRQVLRDWYARGYICQATNNIARVAVDKWLADHG